MPHSHSLPKSRLLGRIIAAHRSYVNEEWTHGSESNRESEHTLGKGPMHVHKSGSRNISLGYKESI